MTEIQDHLAKTNIPPHSAVTKQKPRHNVVSNQNSATVWSGVRLGCCAQLSNQTLVRGLLGVFWCHHSPWPTDFNKGRLSATFRAGLAQSAGRSETREGSQGRQLRAGEELSSPPGDWSVWDLPFLMACPVCCGPSWPVHSQSCKPPHKSPQPKSYAKKYASHICIYFLLYCNSL